MIEDLDQVTRYLSLSGMEEALSDCYTPVRNET